jgi:hypothetical protein
MGTRTGGTVSKFAHLGAGFHLDGGIGYKLTHFIAVKSVLGFDTFGAKNLTSPSNDKSIMISLSMHGELHLGELLHLDTATVGLKAHVGLGVATNSNPGFKNYYESKIGSLNDKGLKGNDDMVIIHFGVSPQYYLTEKISVNADISLVLLAAQTYYVDRSFDNSVNKTLGNILNSSVGLSYKF